jgi:hypothetical protein
MDEGRRGRSITIRDRRARGGHQLQRPFSLRAQFEAFAEDYANGWDSDTDPDWLRDIASDLEGLGEKFGVDTQGYTQGLLERAEDLESDRAEPEPDNDYEHWSADTVVDDVQGMFGGLQSDLKDG